MPNALTNQQINKLGNTIVYLSDKVSNFNKTKILKLLFILEEGSVKKFGHPFFGFDFQLWKLGPVMKDVYIDLSDDNISILKDFIQRSENDMTEFSSLVEFNDDEFSDNDIYLMDKVIEFAKNKTAKELVDYTHNDNSLWRKSAIKNGVLEKLEAQSINSTEHIIDFSLLFEDDSFLKEKYENSLDNLEFINHLKK
jgi:uncharacterized phage-associated protein